MGKAVALNWIQVGGSFLDTVLVFDTEKWLQGAAHDTQIYLIAADRHVLLFATEREAAVQDLSIYRLPYGMI